MMIILNLTYSNFTPSKILMLPQRLTWEIHFPYLPSPKGPF